MARRPGAGGSERADSVVRRLVLGQLREQLSQLLLEPLDTRPQRSIARCCS
jgi:hypothetical protein